MKDYLFIPSRKLIVSEKIGIMFAGFTLLMVTTTACANSSAATAPPIPTSTAVTPSQTPVLSPTASSTPTSTPAPAATLTPTPIPSPTPTLPPVLQRLTTGGCCVQPSFSADGQQVLFLDKPTAKAPVGIYGINLAAPGAAPVLVDKTIGFSSPNPVISATLEDNQVHFTNEKTNQSWTIDTAGNWPNFSPDGRQILWMVTDREGPYDRRQSDLWLATLDGSQPRRVLSLYGGGLAGWFSAGQRLLLLGRDNPKDEEVTLFVYSLNSGQRVNLVSHKRLRGVEMSPQGSWIVYLITFADDPADNGLWVMRSDGSARRKLDLPGFGAYRWRNDNTLLYIPMRPSAADSMQLWAVDVATGQNRPLTQPASLSFSIANGDWDVSPDGNQVVFVSSADQNIWLITLP